MAAAKRFQMSTDPRDNPRSLNDLLAIPVSDLDRCDLARLNLLCAVDLPGAGSIDIDRCLRTIEKWTNRVDFETRRHLYRAKDPRFANRYGGSRAKLRAEMLSQVLQEDCGVRYNPSRILDPDFRNPKDLFIHGMIDDCNGGTCTSMPVLYTALARRLRYPIKLVHAKAHLFCRWDGKDARFNIECTSQGLIFHPDDYYRKWPRLISDEEFMRGEYLVSLSPAQEVAGFFAARGWCLEDHGRRAAAVRAYEVACRLHPENCGYKAFLSALLPRPHPVPIGRAALMMRTPNGFGVPPLADPTRRHLVPIASAIPIMPRPNAPGFPSGPAPANTSQPFNGRHS